MTEANVERVGEDLAYVRGALDRRRRSFYLPLPIAVLWGLGCLVGLGICDFLPRVAGWFWMIGSPTGFVVAFLYFWRFGDRSGEVDWRFAKRQILHWGGLTVAIGVLFLMAYFNRLPGRAIGQLALLLVGLGYFLAGVHFGRAWMWPGVLMVAGAVATLMIVAYVWTVLGVSLCVGLIAPAAARRRGNG